MLAERPPDAPCIHARLRLLDTKSGENCGLILHFSGIIGRLKRIGIRIAVSMEITDFSE
jgi:hypothetical protein